MGRNDQGLGVSEKGLEGNGVHTYDAMNFGTADYSIKKMNDR